MNYYVEVKPKYGDEEGSLLEYATKEEAQEKMKECKEWNENNPDNPSVAICTYGDKVIDKIG